MARRKKRDNGQYEVKATVGKTIDGKPIRKSFYSSRSVADAKRKAEEYKLAQAYPTEDTEPVRQSVAFADWAEQWLETYKRPFVSPATYKSTYAAYVYNHLIPFFGTRRLCNITPADVQRFFAERADKSESFLHKCRFMLSDIFETAIENDLCVKNPARRVKYQSQQTKHEKKALTDEQIQRLSDLCRTARPEVVLMLNTGIRRGELCGLQWADFDRTACTLRIDRSISESGGQCSIRPPKFDSRRTIPLTADALAVIDAQPRNTIWIFPGRTGGYLRPDSWSATLARFMQTVPEDIRCTSHELRHTYGSYLRRHGVDIYTIQKVLGHKNINVTAGIYVHEDIDSIRREIVAEESTTKLRQNYDRKQAITANNG